MKKRLAVLVLAFAMVLTMGASVFAEDTTDSRGDLPSNQGVVNGSKTTVFLTKEYQVPAGVDATETFKFKAEKMTSGNEVDLVTTEADIPAITINDVAIAESMRKSSTDAIVVGSSEITLPQGNTFPRAGVYKWKITETAGSNSKITYSSEEYILRMYVKNVGGNRVVDLVTIETPAGKKVDASTEDSNTSEDKDGDTDASNDGNDFRFTNVRAPEDVETNPTDPEGTKTGAFKLEKTVTGDYGDKTKEFTFTVNVTLPAGRNTIKKEAEGEDPGWDYSAAKITKKDGTVSAKTIVAGDNEVKLADGDAFSITKLPEGTVITVKETGEAHYIPTYEGAYTKAGAVQNLPTPTAQDPGATLTVGENLLVGAKGANVKYTNDFKDSDITPTGIIINNLPYILLIGLALGGIVLFSRKRRYE